MATLIILFLPAKSRVLRSPQVTDWRRPFRSARSPSALYQPRGRVEPVRVLGDHLIAVFAWAGALPDEPRHVERVWVGLVKDGRVVGQVLVLVARDDGARMKRVTWSHGSGQVPARCRQVPGASGARRCRRRHRRRPGRWTARAAPWCGRCRCARSRRPERALRSEKPAPGIGSGQHGRVTNQPGEILVPAVRAGTGLLVHLADGAFGGIDRCAGETLEQPGGAEPVVAVSVGDVDVAEPLAGPYDPVAQRLGLGHCPRWIGQHSVAVAVDEGGRHRRGHQAAAVGHPQFGDARHPVGAKTS